MVRIAKYNIEVDAIANGVLDTFRRIREDAGETRDALADAFERNPIAAGFLDGLTGIDQDFLRSFNAPNISKNIGGILRAGVVAALVGGAAAGGLAIAGAVGGALSQLDDVAELTAVSQRLQVDPAEIQEIGFAARSVSAEFDETIDFITELTKRAAEADVLGGEVAEIFQRIGIDPGQFKLLGPLEQLAELDSALSDLSQPDPLLFLDEIAGDAGVRLSGLFDGNAIGNAAEFFESINGGITGIETAKIAQANQSITELQQTLQIGLQKVLGALAPTIAAVTAGAQAFVAEFLQADRIEPIIGTIDAALDVLLNTVRVLIDATSDFFELLSLGSDFVGLETLGDLFSKAGDLGSRTADAIEAAREAARNIEPIEFETSTSIPVVEELVNAGSKIGEEIKAAAADVESAAANINQETLPPALIRGTSAAVSAANNSIQTRTLENEQRQTNRQFERANELLGTLVQNTTPQDRTINVEVTLTC